MRRDMDLARKILFKIEESDSDPHDWVRFDFPEYDNQKVSYHVMLLAEAGLIEALDVSTMGPDGYRWEATRLTWQGHEFLDAARSDNVWEKAKDRSAKVAGGVTFEVMKELLVLSARELLGLAA